MTTLEILTIPDTRLKHKSTIVESFDRNLKKTINDMFETLHASGNGIGLAAPQVGIKKRIVVIDIKEEDRDFLDAWDHVAIKLSKQQKINNDFGISLNEGIINIEKINDILNSNHKVHFSS